MTELFPERATPGSNLRAAFGLTSVPLADLVILTAVMALAAVLRLWHVTQPLVDVFSWREASTAMMSDNFRTGGWNILFPEVSWTGPGPSYQGREFQLFSYAVAILQALFGWHDWFGRGLAMLFGMVTVFSLHRMTALIWDERHAHAAALCYALLPAAVMIDTSYLPDPAMLALVTLGVWMYLRYWLFGARAVLVIATVSFTLGVLSKLPGLGAGLVIAMLAVALAKAGHLRLALHTVIAVAASLTAIVAWYAWAIYLGTHYPPFHVAGSGYVWDLGLAEFMANAFFFPSLWNLSVWWFYGYPFLALLVIGLWKIPTHDEFGKEPALTLVPLIWLVAGVLIYLLAAKEISSNPWNLHMMHVPVAMFCGRAVVRLIGQGGDSLRSIRGALRMVLMLVAMTGFATLPLVARMKDPQAEEARLLGQELQRLMSPADLIITVAPEVGDPIAVYYSRGRGWVFPPGGGNADWSTFGNDGPEAIAVLEDLHAQGAVWFGVAKNAKDSQGRLFTEHHPALIAHLDATATKVADTSVFLIYRLKAPTAP
ncbi:ArnT family glycosyltransferase [Rhodobacter ferrooxidans]|uniref:Putative transmembrane protein n=1 Tax=Rhodobacter ferrooxidans TaxID=371731 RepID=C8S373_9RHOB|nr:glycosyltransferase family 39 protein [Rhodobacter sp. SW2]EEW24555.1 putative transmembrane protein [Rhodobacter sp. SW2]